MSELLEGRPWGMCAAYGCPLPGSMGQSAGDGRWWCFCHINRPSSSNDEISMMLNSDEFAFIVQTTKETRGVGCDFFGHEELWKRIALRMRTANRLDLMPSEKDKSPHKPTGSPLVSLWLYRLETILSDEANKISQQSAVARFTQPAKLVAMKSASSLIPNRLGGPA